MSAADDEHLLHGLWRIADPDYPIPTDPVLPRIAAAVAERARSAGSSPTPASPTAD